MPNADKQEIEVNYITAPSLKDDPIYIFNAGGDASPTLNISVDGKPTKYPIANLGLQYPAAVGQNKQLIQQAVNGSDFKNQVKITLADGTQMSASQLQLAGTNQTSADMNSGKFHLIINTTFNNGFTDAGQPLIFANPDSQDPGATQKFAKAVKKAYKDLGCAQTTPVNVGTLPQIKWQRIKEDAFAIMTSVKNIKNEVVDLTNGPTSYTENDGRNLSNFVENPVTVKGGPHGTINVINNLLSGGNKVWPAGTTFEWQGDNGEKSLVLDKAGETRNGNIVITLPSGSRYTVKDITLTTKVNVKAESRTIDYGTKLTAKDLVTNTDVFPEGTTFQYVGNEPNWMKPGSYNDVQITATYYDQGTKKNIVTPVAHCNVAINDSRRITVLKGYTAYTSGPADNKNKVPANQFVFPTWNSENTSLSSNASIAYTDAASVYEAKPVHTILYIPDEVQTRTLTAHFKIAGGEHNGKTIAPDAQVQVLFKKAGTLDTATNKIVYTGNWAPDWDAGDEATPVFHVISGSWSLPPKGNDASIGLTSPSRDGYTVANIRYDGSYSTFTFANPNYNSNTVYMNNDNDVWYMRNDLTTYYVPNSLLNKSVTRTITIKEPGQADRTITQTAKLSRQVKVNGDDTGVTFEGFDGSGWKADSNWGVQDVPIHAGYTPLQLVNG